MRIAFVSAIVLSLAVLPAPSHAWPWDAETPALEAPAEIGRFQIIVHPGSSIQTFLLDTVSGKVWQLTRYTDLEGEPLAWGEMSVLSTFSDYDTFSRTHRAKKNAPKQ